MKMKLLMFYTLLFAGVLNNAFGQTRFILKGVLIDKETRLRIALAEVKNKQTGQVSGSDDMGFFKLLAGIGDSIVITKRNFTDLEITVSGDKDLVLYLNKGTSLKEVIITGQSKKRALDEIRKEFRDKGSYYNGKPPLKLLLPFGGSPLTFFYELFGKTPAKARRFNRMYTNETQNSQVDAFYNKSTINKSTGLEGKELEKFLMDYRPDYEKTKNWTVYDATKWIKDSYKNYTDTLKKIN